MLGKDLLIAIFIVVIWGVNFVAIAWGLEGMPPLLMGGLRFLLVASVGALFLNDPIPHLYGGWPMLCLLAFCNLHFYFQLWPMGCPLG